MKRQDMPPQGELTPPSRFTLEYVDPAPELAQLVTTFYHFQCDDREIRDIQPAAIGHLALFPLGKGAMSRPDGGSDPSHEVNLLTPFAQAMPFVMKGPFHAVGAALTPLGWAGLTGLHAGEHANRLYDATDYLPQDAVQAGKDACAAYRAGEADGPALIALLGGLIAANLALPAERYMRLIGVTAQWLAASDAPEIEDLYAASPYSRRQTQRLVERFFGSSPVALRRKYRALRAAALFARPDLTDAQADAVIGAFYDQPHMIHEIRYFAGRTPARLSSDDTPYLRELVDIKNLRELGS